MEIKSSSKKIIISIDFEMRWGVHDLYGLNIEGYKKNLINSRQAVTSTLNMFKERNIRATWATVGALALNDWNEYFSYNSPIPNYSNKKLKILDSYSKIDPEGLFHFAPDLVKSIVETEGQELGSHSFSHLYFLEEGITAKDFVDDALLVKKIFEEKFKSSPVSIVFPRNQINFKENFYEPNLMIYRSIPDLYSYNSNLRKIINLYEILSPIISGPFNQNTMYSTGNFFIRFNLPNVLWKLQLKKIKNKLMNLRNGENLHIWWHPHNVGVNLEKGLDRFEQLFDLIANEININDLTSCNMKDLLNK